jgi:glucose-1-phosphate thymidylyltransferase
MPAENTRYNSPNDLIGVIPAAGTASRLGALPCSKEIYPVGLGDESPTNQLRPKPAIVNLLEKMNLAEVTQVFIVLRDGKWDIPAYLGSGGIIGLPIGYLITDSSLGVPFTVDQAFPIVKEAMVVFGFADILCNPQDGFSQMLTRQAESKADIVLGLFFSHRPQDEDLVELGKNGRVIKIEVKPKRTNLKYTWLIAIWTPAFTRFLHNYVIDFKKNDLFSEHLNRTGKCDEVFMGEMFNAAIDSGLYIDQVIFKDGIYLDIGTPDNLAKASNFNVDSV